ncbi:MAG TPA: penicillin-binding transpeptidase domain-containing protein, partial [Phycisphaerales bacterium]|nr:penicillin-binding transpeptidase domain-containing protein [Phycisphaerales bacterium]
FEVRRLAEKYPGLRVETGGRRIYPMESADIVVDRTYFPTPAKSDVENGAGPLTVHVDGIATHVLGWMRSIQREDVAKRPRVSAAGVVDRGWYREGDTVGAQGIESAKEGALRGLRGRRIIHLDSGSEESIEPIPGADVTLTIDAALQARIQAVMSPEAGLARVQAWHASASETQVQNLVVGTPLTGAAVVLEVDSGEVLALVSTPSFTREDLKKRSEWVWKDAVESPWVNRAIGKPYPPGSVVKPLILSAAVTEGLHSLDKTIDCTGHLYPDKPTQFRCWVYKQFGRTHNDYLGRGLVADEAIAMSCNIFFYTLGRALGPDKLPEWFRKFGIGVTPGWGIGPEFAGTIGGAGKNGVIETGDATLMGIGQGPVAWTPLHAADAYATLARGGMFIMPRIVRDERPATRRLTLDPRAVDAGLEGLRRAVNDTEIGTGEHLSYTTAMGGGKEKIFTAPGVSVWGKTGTAEAPDIVADPDGPEGQPPSTMRSGDHSWFVILVGPEHGPARYAVAVIMEYAGSGARVSGPIANQVIMALKAEGYL